MNPETGQILTAVSVGVAFGSALYGLATYAVRGGEAASDYGGESPEDIQSGDDRADVQPFTSINPVRVIDNDNVAGLL